MTIFALLMLTAACGRSEAAAPAGSLAPRGATIGSGGHATILDAPPAHFAPAVAGEPKPPTAAQIADQEQFRRAGEFQNKVGGDVRALARKLRVAEKGNFVDLYFENDGDPHVVFRFLRDGKRTLAKYTKHPRFFATEVRYSRAELERALDFMMTTFRDDRVIAGGGYGSKSNRADIEINVPEAEFRALVARKGVTIPDAVKLEFRVTQSARDLNRPLPPSIAPLVRIFPRSDRPVGLVNAINSQAKVVLRDGCFRAPDQGDALVQFPLGEQLFVDRAGYLAFGTGETPGYARVGEEVVFMGSIAEVTAPELVAPIRKACGAGRVIAINATRSTAADRAQYSASSNAQSMRELRESYGLNERQARKVLAKCAENFGGGTCVLTPPPPVPSAAACPAGTKLSFGLCRTPEGHIRPLPKWIARLL
ncbi:hypothetical protein H9L13_07065 [Sphingomonas lutea]|uniref:Uncharacterized protein n=1 Tax=Sphingomonas lutea TaxID=1045317 RepID=A0A7G9SF61_9SPHN|nr:hypothetical protein [Sphingomonas lutea]QNN66486.1 hypothetical protein H9L13_07065 [Sphingomonas lutea]